MKIQSPFMQRFDQLPDTLPVFPLSNAVVLPGGKLPLNIFEPRYLNMLQDSIESHHLIGMIQPRDEEPAAELFQVGCAGRITRYEEISDGRLEIILTGLCRFRVAKELSTTRGYRLIVPNWSGFQMDFDGPLQQESKHRSAFISALHQYLNQNEMKADWNMLDQLGAEELSNSLVSILPLTKEDKQILIETDTPEQRIRAFAAILEGNHNVTEIRH